MAIDDRIKHVVREEVSKALAAPDTGDQLRDLHAELHSLATRVARLEQRLNDPEPAKAPAARSRKVTDQG